MAKKRDDNVSKRGRSRLSFAAGVLGPGLSGAESARADAVMSAMNDLRRTAEQWQKLTPDKLNGYLYECIEIAYGGRLTPAGTEVADAVVGGKLVQFKTGQTARHTANNIRAHIRKHAGKPGMDNVRYSVPKDQAAEVQDILDPRIRVKGGRTSMSELTGAGANPHRFASRREIGALAKKAREAGTQAAAIGGALGGAMSAIQNLPAWFKGDIDGERAAKNIAVDSIRSPKRRDRSIGSHDAFGAGEIECRCSRCRRRGRCRRDGTRIGEGRNFQRRCRQASR